MTAEEVVCTKAARPFVAMLIKAGFLFRKYESTCLGLVLWRRKENIYDIVRDADHVWTAEELSDIMVDSIAAIEFSAVAACCENEATRRGELNIEEFLGHTGGVLV